MSSQFRRTRVKMCGMTRAEDVAAAVAAGVDAVGFVFYPPSPRHVDIDRAACLMRDLPPFVSRVGLFVNAERAFIEAHLSALPIDVIQFHGDEEPEDCAGFGRPWLRVARVRPGLDLLESTRLATAAGGCVGLLADTYSDQFGGSGKQFDWSLIPSDLPLPLVLSGGLTPDTVGAAIRRLRPWAVDVSSGIEGERKGVKDAGRIMEFMRGVRDADARLAV
jgi:phosphoribosylanthranilate isomerase